MPDPFIGEIRAFAFHIVPTGWAPCDGAWLHVNDHAALYSIIGNIYGGDGVRTFRLPNLVGRVPVNFGPQVVLGEAKGEEEHVLALGEIPHHTHVMRVSNEVPSAVSPENNVPGSRPGYYSPRANQVMSSQVVSDTGQFVAHPNMQPYTVVNFCIAVEGEYPYRD